MSWLSDMFGGGDDTDWAAVARERQAREDKLRAEQKAEQEKADAIAKQKAFRESSTATGRQSAMDYFSQLGLDPSQYSGAIESEIQRILGTTAEDDPNVGSYFADLGESVYGNQEQALRSRASRDIENQFSPEFERTRIGDTADDSILAEIQAAERGEAESYIDNLLRRGVITGAGKQAAVADLDEQSARVRGILDEIGQTTLAGGRQKLTDIANRGRETAGTIRLGTQFDPSTYGSQAQGATDEFLANLGTSIRGKVTDDLFDTSGLAAIAGAAQGAGNTKFDPTALAGIIPQEDDEDEEDLPFAPRRATF